MVDPIVHPNLFSDNRARFMNALGEDAALFFGAKHYLRNGDAEFLYRQSSDILYLCGWTDPDVAILLRPKSDQPFTMFVQQKDKTKEIWTGRRPGPEGALSEYGADQAFPISELETRLPGLLQGHKRLHYRFAENHNNDVLLMKAIAIARKKGKANGLDFPEIFVDPSHVLHRLRLIKSSEEIRVMKHAAEITAQAHKAAMSITAPGANECELEAEIAHVFRKSGGTGPGYTTIVGGGENAVILHYIDNNQTLKDGDLVCVDAGCEYAGYTADVTRTWPVNGRFSSAQKALYQAVLKAQLSSIEAAVPGSAFIDVHNAAVESLTASLIELGFLEGDLTDLIQEEAYKPWYMHGTSHWLGLDVHDVGPYGGGGESLVLEPGMVLTIEPGLYIGCEDKVAPKEFLGIGIRIEDDILIGENGPINLTVGTPKTIEEIEAWMSR